MKSLENLTLGEIVAEIPKAAKIFGKYEIDFCCHGNRKFNEACIESGLDASVVESEIKKLDVDDFTKFDQWPLSSIIDYIFENHHQYIEQATPAIKNLVAKICAVHGSTHPELFEIQKIFIETSEALAVHMKKEEMILFPRIVKLERLKIDNSTLNERALVSISDAIQKMEADHVEAGDQLKRIKALSNNFTPPKDACFSYTITYQMLKEFEEDMHMHIHLENNILFPLALEAESDLNTTAVATK